MSNALEGKRARIWAATRERIVSSFIERLRGVDITEEQYERLHDAILVASAVARARRRRA